MQKSRSRLAGQRVDVRGEPWLVVRTEPFDACTLVTLRGTGAGNLGRTTELVEPFDRLKTTSMSPRIRRASRRTTLRGAAGAIARAHSWVEPWVAATARIDLLPWQLGPAMAAVGGATRLLLADGVGLGKTVQAGLILAELRARGFISRALILTPASLREQWAMELGDRFALNPVVLDHAALTRLAAELPPHINPWSVAEIAISSIDLVKRGEVRRALDAIPLDALVVDEAHHLRPGTDRGALVEDLAARVPWLVLATATPHSGDEQAFAFLRGLGALDGAADIQTFRRGRRAVGTHKARRAVFHGVRLTPAEKTLFDETFAYAQAVWRQHNALVACVICRRAVSSAPALIRTLARRRELLSSDHPPDGFQNALPWQENDERDAVESDQILGAARLDAGAREVEWLDRLIRLATQADESSKAAALERLLARTSEAAIVFSEYRDTLVFLQERFCRRTSCAVIHGGLSARQRREAIQHFVSGRARVLFATDAAGEGLNLQQRCRLVVNLELPWSPLRLEQRAGRVDRLGQTRRVHAIHLVHRGSFEDAVLARLERRVHRAARDLNELHLDERDVAQAVFAGNVHLAGVKGFDGPYPCQASDTDGAGGVELRRRAMTLLTTTVPLPEPLCAAPGARHVLTERVAVLFECDFHDEDGRLVAREAVPLIVDHGRRIVLRRRNIRDIARAVAASRAVHERLTAAIAERTAAIVRETGGTCVGLEQRLEQILCRLESTTPPMFQGSLFDHRAEQQARGGEAAACHIRAHLRHRLANTRALLRVHPSMPRLIAVWAVETD